MLGKPTCDSPHKHTVVGVVCQTVEDGVGVDRAADSSSPGSVDPSVFNRQCFKSIWLFMNMLPRPCESSGTYSRSRP